ncbi:D-alanyl-D-alanine carboxypeptidase / D-alanyl-D-alanine-endopeptidase (penicillin-binding protein 4) [Halobacillus karajensis]|nr:D-alanyl-D-alanine carboxypeptidase/D-alanyl-D-alanine-endopeptidase [Halobacillus karajensis]SEH68573.1 D-alanyl-D-alanine carboxypeptidase / D-alanyl-D-alanine-endopeptidase (penicillin-binding protein 4) [Halobacillus karajensis]
MFSMKSKHFVVPFLAALMMFTPYQSVETEVDASKEDTSLNHELDQILQNEKLNGALSGISIRLAETGEVLYEKNADVRLKPASNMKLFSGAAAMETLGPDYTFQTEVWADGDIKGNKLHGDLYLKGKGDPTLMVEDLDAMAQSLKEAGVREVKGDLIADDTWYDDVRLSEDISWNDETRYYGSQISALTVSPNEDYDAGTVIVAAYPSEKEGEPAQIELTPETDYVQVVNQTETVPADGEKDVTIERKHGTNQIIVEGTIPTEGSRSRSWIAVSEPTGLALELFKQSLTKQGIKVKGDMEIHGNTPADSELMVSKESMALEDIYIPFMKLSNNGHAEVLVKEMGKRVHEEGSWEKGLEVVEDYMSDIGVESDTLRLRDGSGMSHVNMIPAHEISELLYQVQDKDWFPAYLKSLPVAGNSERFVGGTIRSRMQDTAAQNNVKAKTGSLTGVSSLSGYVTTADGETLIFALVFNNYLDDVEDIEDEIAVTLAEHHLAPSE